MNSTVLMIAFVLGVVVWLMVLTGLTGKAKKEAYDALTEAARVHDLLLEYIRRMSEMVDRTEEIRVAAKDAHEHNQRITNSVAEMGKSVEEMRLSVMESKVALKHFIATISEKNKVLESEIEAIMEESNDREQDEEDGDDLEGGDPETTGQGSP